MDADLRHLDRFSEARERKDDRIDPCAVLRARTWIVEGTCTQRRIDHGLPVSNVGRCSSIVGVLLESV
jgi:hypothetical protein